MPKNIVICCDGTANEFARNRTNVVKLYYALEHDKPQQIAFYHPGVGTMEPAGALGPISRKVTIVLGLALGYGLTTDIRDAYTFLMNRYEDGDKVYLFGFSRGAYTVRAVCSLLTMYGLIRPGNDALVPYAVRMMMGIDRAAKLKARGRATSADEDAVKEYFKLAEDFKNSMGRTGCNPHFVGVWDTVSSVGWFEDPVKIPFTADNPSIMYGRHAIAIDEKRAFFRTNRWIPSRTLTEHGPKDMKQVWFAGVHCDVGGGYPEKDSGLSKIALEWMLEEAKAVGLCVNPERQREILGQLPGDTRYAKPDPDGLMHESLKGAWKLAEVIEKPHFDFKTQQTVKRANRGRRRTIPQDASIHESVYQRDKGVYAERLQLPGGCKPVATVRVPDGAAMPAQSRPQ